MIFFSAATNDIEAGKKAGSLAIATLTTLTFFNIHETRAGVVNRA